jgi:replicative DNA helicase Mcm
VEKGYSGKGEFHLMSIQRNETAKPSEVFKNFFRLYDSDQNGSKYRNLLAQLSKSRGKSLLIDFEDIVAFDPALARNIVERPEQYISFADLAATAQMRVEDAEYASLVGRIFSRFRRLPERTTLNRINAESIGKLVFLEGNISKVGRIEVMLVQAAYRCRKCFERIILDQEGELTSGPGHRCLFCKQTTSFELLEEESEFVDCQHVTIEDAVATAPSPNISISQVDGVLKRDLVDTTQLQDEVDVTGIVKVQRSRHKGSEFGRLFPFLDVNYLEKARQHIGKPSAPL